MKGGARAKELASRRSVHEPSHAAATARTPVAGLVSSSALGAACVFSEVKVYGWVTRVLVSNMLPYTVTVTQTPKEVSQNE